MPNLIPEQALSTIIRNVKNAICDVVPAAPKPQKLGLAISGGVDSMALATLTSLIRKDLTFQHTFTGFIVDHKLRDGSAKEAAAVARSLELLDIESRIISLDWSSHGNPRELSNLESVARTLRYQALGKACASQEISYLMFGHHADDQAETVLSRAVNGYTGLGLQGIATTAPIPECAGLHGVDRSGTPRLPDGDSRQPLIPTSPFLRARRQPQRIAVEDGGVAIHRPLLGCTKKELQDICRAHGVPWHEDPTNADRTLTIRNTIRALQATDVLPKALQWPRLLESAQTVRARMKKIQAHAQTLFDRTSIELDFRSGTAVISMSDTGQDLSATQHTHHVKAEFVRKLLLLVSPTADVSLQDLDHCADLVFAHRDASRSLNKSDPHTSQIASVSLTRTESAQGRRCPTITLQRDVPVRSTRESMMQVVQTHGGWSEWLLWDHRYWIRVYEDDVARSPSTSMHITYLSPESLGQLRNRLKDMKPRADSLERALSVAPGKLRWTLPALTSRTNGEDRIVALPSLDWKDVSWELFRIERPRKLETRYKNIDFPKTDCHKLTQ